MLPRTPYIKPTFKLILECALRKQRLGQLLQECRTLDAVVSDIGAEQYRKQLIDAATKAEAARIAASELFKNEPLPHTGSEIWRALWESARAYSTQEAYPKQTFPVASPSDHCVLCQPKLSADASERLSKFETFVRENAHKASQDAKVASGATKSKLTSATFTYKKQIEVVALVRDELESVVTATELRKFLTLSRWRRRALLKATHTSWPELPEMSDSALAALQKLEIEVTARITELHNSVDAAARKILETEKQELEDRVWLSTVLEEVRKEIERRKHVATITASIADTDTRTITSKSTTLADKWRVEISSARGRDC